MLWPQRRFGPDELALIPAPAGNADTGRVFNMSNFPGGRVLIDAENGLFLVRAQRGTVTSAGNADTGRVFLMRDLPGSGLLIWARNGWFLAREIRRNGTCCAGR